MLSCVISGIQRPSAAPVATITEFADDPDWVVLRKPGKGENRAMSGIRTLAVAGLLAALCSTTTLAAAPRTRIRGTIESAKGDTLAVKTYAGTTANLVLDVHTKYISVLPARLADIKSGDFVGIGATGPDSKIVALEVVIFPASMRGTGEGHYGWSVPAVVAAADRHESTALPSGAPPVEGTMTNGTVVASASSAPPVTGSMTNGTVASNTGAAGGEELTVTYDHGRKVQILVPTDVPVVRLAPAGPSILVSGAKAFAVATQAGSGQLTANFVAVGENGLMPPM